MLAACTCPHGPASVLGTRAGPAPAPCPRRPALELGVWARPAVVPTGSCGLRIAVLPSPATWFPQSGSVVPSSEDGARMQPPLGPPSCHHSTRQDSRTALQPWLSPCLQTVNLWSCWSRLTALLWDMTSALAPATSTMLSGVSPALTFCQPLVMQISLSHVGYDFSLGYSHFDHVVRSKPDTSLLSTYGHADFVVSRHSRGIQRQPWLQPL